MESIIIFMLAAVLLADIATLVIFFFMLKGKVVFYNVERKDKITGDNKKQTVLHLTPAHERKLAEEMGYDDEF